MAQKPLGSGYSPLVDAHAHIGVVWPDEHIIASVDDSIRLMDLCGIERACSSASRYLRFDFREGNRMTLAAVRAHPDRIIGSVIVDPRRPDESVEELDNYLGREGFRGIKLHISHSRTPYDDPAYQGVYECAERHGVPVLAHTFSRLEVSGLLAAARRFARVAFLVGHSGGYVWADTMGAIAEVPNACFDLCCSCMDAGRVEAFVAAAGAERVIFGTDLPMLHPASVLSQVVNARLSDSEKALILGGNILRLMGEAQ